MKKRTSIHDIAKHLKVSATAISFVLNGKGREKGISEDLEKRILAYVESIGYQPNLIAKSLRTGKSNIIAMLVESISDPFFASIAKGVETNAYKLGYKVFFASTENETEKTKALIAIFNDRQVDGYIIAPPPGIEKEIRFLIDAGRPVIIFDRYLPEVETTNIVIDNYLGSYKAVRHLINNGFSKIGLVTLDSEQTQMVDRLKGYRKALEENKLPENIKTIVYNQPQNEILQQLETYFKKEKKLDAVFFSTNYLALSGLEAIRNLNLMIPDDLAVVSFDDNDYFRLCSPTITAVVQPVEEISLQAVNSLMQALAADKEAATTKQTKVLSTRLVVRNSSGSSNNNLKPKTKTNGKKIIQEKVK